MNYSVGQMVGQMAGQMVGIAINLGLKEGTIMNDSMILDLVKRIDQVCTNKFGKNRIPIRAVHKIGMEELPELAKAMRDSDMSEVYKEAADVFILTCDLLFNRLKLNPDYLVQNVSEKLDLINSSNYYFDGNGSLRRKPIAEE